MLVKVITRGSGSFTPLSALTDSSHCKGASARVVSRSVIMVPPSKKGPSGPFTD